MDCGAGAAEPEAGAWETPATEAMAKPAAKAKTPNEWLEKAELVRKEERFAGNMPDVSTMNSDLEQGCRLDRPKLRLCA
jgi:hypothetical protein